MVKIKYLVLMVGALLLSLLWMPNAFASGNFYMTGGSVLVGQTITVSLRIDPGTTINAVQATVNYDSSMLQYDSYSLGVFNICGQQPSGNNLTFGCAMSGSTSSDSLVGTLTFTALVGSGSTNLSISNDSAAYNGANVSVSASGSTIDFTSPAPAPSPTPTPSPAPAPSPTRSSYRAPSYIQSSTTPTATPATTAPAATPSLPKVSLKLSGIRASFTGAKIRVEVNHPVTVFFEYGTTAHYLPHLTSPVSVSKNALVAFGSVSLMPATTYYYKLVAQYNGTTVASSPIQKFTTKGLTISVAVLDGHYRPLTNRPVVLHSKAYTAVTDALGVATFYNVAPGLHHLDYVIDGLSYSQPVYVPNDIVRLKDGSQTARPQTASVVFRSYYQAANNVAQWAYPIITLLVVTAVFLISGPRILAHRIIRLMRKVRNKL